MTASESTAADASEAEEATLVGKNMVTGYGNNTVIKDVTVESRDGVTCIFGPNGSGKSTLLKSLSGKKKLWSGSVTYGDQDLTDLPAHEIVERDIATVPQDGGLFGSMSVHENLQLGGHVLDDEVVNERIETVYDTFPLLEEKRSTNARSLSGGQQMLLSFGRAMILDADMYLLDEPSAGLAPSLIDDVIEMIETLVDRGAQVVLVEQNVRAALRIADYVYLLAQGELQFEGTPDDLSEQEELMDLYLGIR